MKNLFSHATAVLCAVTFLGTSPTLLRAEDDDDDVVESIKEALGAYYDEDFVMATQALETAVQLIKQKKGETLASLFPEPGKAPIQTWEAYDAESQAASSAFFGGAVSAERVYTRGDSEITVKYLTDSPMLQGIMMMLGNPMFANADGGKLIRINGQRAVLKYDASDKSGSLKFAVNNLLLVEIEGEEIERDDLEDFGEAVPNKEIGAVL